MAERDDILLTSAAEEAAARPLRARIAAFVPIAVALIGVGAILGGGISAGHRQMAAATAVDAMTTGSVPTPAR